MQKINIIIKNTNLVVNLWSEIIQTVNLYCNIFFVVKYFVIFFEASIRYLYNYKYIRHINQQREVLKI